MTYTRSVTAALLAAAVIAAPAAAEPIVDVSFRGLGLGRTVKVNLNGDAKNVFAGQLFHSFANGQEEAAALNGEFITYCTELTKYVDHSPHPFELVDLADAPNTDPMGALSAGALVELYAGAGGQQFTDASSGDNRDFAAAFQIAVWEAVYDFDGTPESLDATSGDLAVTKTNGKPLGANLASHLDALFGAIGSDAPFGGLVAVSAAGKQDQLVVVPAPPTAMACLLLLIGAGRRRRRAEA